MRSQSARPTLRLLLALILMQSICAGCKQTPATAYDTPERSPEALRSELRAACAQALAGGHPMLIEFSAPWCSDCQRLGELKRASPLAEELAEWPTVVVNVRQFDLHVDLLAAFGVEQIAHWAILAPSDCDTPVQTWPRLAGRKLEPQSGAERSMTPADLAAWLGGFR